MKIVLVPLLFLLFASCLGIARLLGYVDFTGEAFEDSYFTSYEENYTAVGNLSVGEDETLVSGEMATVKLSAVVSSGVITLIVTSLALAVVSGITVLGSGLNEEGTKAVWKGAAYFGVWALFSVLAVTMFAAIPVFGMPFYFLLTLFYSVGVLGSISGGG